MSEYQRWDQQERRHARAMRAGLLASLLGHALLFVLFLGDVAIPVSPFSAAGERAGSPVAARGGGMEAIQLATPTPEPPVEPTVEPVPVEEPEAPPEETELLVDVPAIALATGMAAPGEPGPAIGPGLAEGEGEGDGGTDAEGLFRVVPPRPRGLILPPADRPTDVRGKEVEVWVYVSAAGKVVADSTRLLPPTGDRRFDRRLRDHASGWVFEAARRDGRAVGEWFRYVIVM